MNFFDEFADKWVPVLDWQMFSSRAAAEAYFNSTNWTGWNQSWEPIAYNTCGDAIIVDEHGDLCCVAHGTGEDPKPYRYTSDLEALAELMRKLVGLPQYAGENQLGGALADDCDLDVLRTLRTDLRSLRKLAPRNLKHCFNDEIETVGEAISDKRFTLSKRGQFYEVCWVFAKKCYKELRVDGKYASAYISPYRNRRRLRAFGWLKDGETEEEVKRVVARNDPPFPIDFGPFKPDEG